METARALLRLAGTIAILAAGGAVRADEACRWEKCDFPLMSAGKPLSAICACYRTECNQPAATMECACEEARAYEGAALDGKGSEAGRMSIGVVPGLLPAEAGQSATISVDVDLSGIDNDDDASFRVDVSSGTVSPNVFSVAGRSGRSPPIAYSTAEDAKPGDVLVRVYGGWSVILLGVSTGEVYEGKACFRLE